MTAPKTCEKCRFFKVDGLECHRYPPKIIYIEEIYNRYFEKETVQSYLGWPEVLPSDFCGEFQPWPEMKREEKA
jgi:hypothetical protein